MPGSFKSFYDQHRVWIGVASALAILLVAAWRLTPQIAPPTRVETIPNTWFYDLESRRLFVHADVQPELVKSPHGGTSARAVVYACGDCGVADKRFAAWLETEEWVEGKKPTSPEVARMDWSDAREAPLGDVADDALVQLKIRGEREYEWHTRDADAVQRYARKAQERCDDEGEPLTACPATNAK